MKTWGYSSTLSSTSTLDEDRIGGQQHAPVTLPPGMRVSTNRTGGGVALGTGLDRQGEITSSPKRDLNPEPSSSQQVVRVYKSQILISIVILSLCRK